MSILRTPYPHLLPEDTEVWARWLKRNAHLFERFEYDIQVGTGRDPGTEHPENIRAMAVGLSRRRIDAVGHRPAQVWLFEVTRLADLKCLGQVQAYPLLYAQTFRPLKPIRTAVVCESLGTDLEQAYRLANVTVYRV